MIKMSLVKYIKQTRKAYRLRITYDLENILNYQKNVKINHCYKTIYVKHIQLLRRCYKVKFFYVNQGNIMIYLNLINLMLNHDNY